MTDDERAIREVVERWMAATRAGDTAAVLDLMTDDVIFMTPNGEPFGKGVFRERSQSLVGVEIHGHAEVKEVHVAGDWAWIRNLIAMTMNRPDGEKTTRSGWTLTVLKRCDDGRWRLFRDANLVT